MFLLKLTNNVAQATSNATAMSESLVKCSIAEAKQYQFKIKLEFSKPTGKS